MSDQIASTPLHGPTTYDFGEATPKEWPQGEYVPKSVYDILAASVDRLTSDKARLAAELAAMTEKAGGYSNQADRFVMQVRALEAALRKHMDHHDGCESNDWSNESDWITTSFGFVLKSNECSCGANQLALTLDPAAKAIVYGYESETACTCRPKAALHGAHYPGCPQAETKGEQHGT